MHRINLSWFVLFLMSSLLFGCSNSTPPEEKKKTVWMILDTGGDRDNGFNEYSLKGAREAAEAAGMDFHYLLSEASNLYERNIEKAITEGADLVFTVGFALANATAKAAIKYPDRHFAILDYEYSPGNGCSETVSDCYTKEGGLSNISSLMFTEDQPAYLAGILAACMSKTGVIATVAAAEIPPVVRFVKGFENGARSVRPDIITHHKYIPDFNAPDTGWVVAMDYIAKGADVLFCGCGTTGHGVLKAAHENNLMAVGVDVDQYKTFPEAGSAIITSAMKNVDTVAADTVTAFSQGTLAPGIKKFSLENKGIDLAPYHEWADKIPQDCLTKVEEGRKRILSDPSVTLSPQE